MREVSSLKRTQARKFEETPPLGLSFANWSKILYDPMLQTKCPPKILKLNPNSQCDSIWMWGLWEVIKP